MRAIPDAAKSLLNDLCGSYRREINVLTTAVEERVPLDLLAGAGSMPLELLLTRLEKRLEEQTALTGEAARWAVESWAVALNLASENDISRRQNQIEFAAPPAPKTENNCCRAILPAAEMFQTLVMRIRFNRRQDRREFSRRR